MAIDMFLKIDDIKGESADDKHPNEIQVLSWSWGLSQSGTAHQGAGGGAGKVNVQDLTITKYLDSSTPTLMNICCAGKHMKKALLTVRKAGGHPLEYLKITLEDVLVSSLSPGGSGGEDRVTESLSLNFARFKTEYVPQKPDGSGGPVISAGFDIAANKVV
jgi:type VI secretion system secreted protein Hcp